MPTADIGDRSCLVTGGSGVIGRALVAALGNAGAHVRVVDRRELSEGADGVEQVRGDVGDPAVLREALTGCDVVFHVAGALPQALLGESGFRAANVGPTEQVVRAAATAGTGRVVLASTVEVYGAQDMAVPLTEDASLRFTGPYSHSKWEAEDRLFAVGREVGVETAAVRLPMVLGPGFYHEPSTLTILGLLRRGVAIPIPAGDLPVSYVSARDAAQGFILAATRAGADVDWQAFNLAAADTPPMGVFFRELASRVGSRSRPVSIPLGVVRGAVAGAKRVGHRRGAVAGTPVELV